jgi:glycosyltransferase involved in cell wall biosynthesis
LRIAIVHDWLYVLGGAEKVLKGMLACFPSADVFCLFDILSDEDRASIGFKQARTSFFQRLPGIRKHHRSYLPLMPLAVEQLDLGAYDIVISSSYAVAKGVLTGPDQLHLAYVHSPMRYAWDLQHEYLREAKLERGPKSWLVRAMLHRIRVWDSRTSHGVDAYMSNSHFVARRIRKIYGRSATVIHPPVGVPDALSPVDPHRDGFFLAASRLVAYKNIRAIVEAFRHLPDQKLVVAGTGPEADRLRAQAGPNVSFVGFVPDHKLRQLMRDAQAFIFAAEEDFGMVPVEVQGEGTPVIGLRRGGLRETVIEGGTAPTGLFFERPEPEAIAEAVRRFEDERHRFSRNACHSNALRFSEARFEEAFTDFVEREYRAFRKRVDFGLASPLPATPDMAVAALADPALGVRAHSHRTSVVATGAV